KPPTALQSAQVMNEGGAGGGMATQNNEMTGSAAAANAGETTRATTGKGTNKGRSGGVVDAPGKKHRKPAPADPRLASANTRPLSRKSTPRTQPSTLRRRGRA